MSFLGLNLYAFSNSNWIEFELVKLSFLRSNHNHDHVADNLSESVCVMIERIGNENVTEFRHVAV